MKIRFIHWRSAAWLAIVVGGALASFAVVQAFAEDKHSFRVLERHEMEPMHMPPTTNGGMLERELKRVIPGEGTLKQQLTMMKDDSGFYGPNAIMAMQEDPVASTKRYTRNGLLGTYQRVFMGEGAISEVQASVLRFRTPRGALFEMQFGEKEESNGPQVTRLPRPFGKRSFALMVDVSMGTRQATGVLVSWVLDSDLAILFVSGESQEPISIIHLANRFAREMHERQQAQSERK